MELKFTNSTGSLSRCRVGTCRCAELDGRKGVRSTSGPNPARIREDLGRSMTVVKGFARDAPCHLGRFRSFSQGVGVAPTEYATRWRMTLAKELLRKGIATDEIAWRAGYGSASTFSATFRRIPQRARSRSGAVHEVDRRQLDRCSRQSRNLRAVRRRQKLACLCAWA